MIYYSLLPFIDSVLPYMLFGNENFNHDAYPGIIDNYKQWLELNGVDAETPIERVVWEKGQLVKIKLPLIAARPRTVEQYRTELSTAGFEFISHELSKDNPQVSFCVRKPA